MEINEMTLEELQVRATEIKAEAAEASEERCNAILAELETIEERKKQLEEIELRNKQAAELTANKVQPDKMIERNEEKMATVELRNTPEYGKAFVNMILTGKDEELRSLLSTNATGGKVPVPELLETEIKNAWEACEVINLVKKSYYSGNVKVGFELSATGAVVHQEGTNAPEEEVLTWGTVELKAESIKKWITVSDEAIDGTTIDTLGEIYREVAQKIAEKAEDLIIGKIVAAPATSDATHCGVPTYTGTGAVTDFTMAIAELSGKARNLVAVMNRRTEAAYKAANKNGKYGLVDPFDGVRVVVTDALDALSAADTGDTFVIIGDFGYGFQCNFPAGNDMTIKVDDLSLAEKDLVKIVGRQFVGMGVVAPKAFVKIVK